MIRAAFKNALVAVSLSSALLMARAAVPAATDVASEVSDVATLAPNPPHRFFTGGFRQQSFTIFDADSGKMEGSIPAGYVSNLAIAPDNSHSSCPRPIGPMAHGAIVRIWLPSTMPRP